MSSIIIPPTYKVGDEVEKLSDRAKKDYAGITFYLVGLDFDRSFSDNKYPDIFISLDKKYVPPILDDLMPKYIDKAIERRRDSIEWSKARTIEEVKELEKLLKLREKYNDRL